MATNYQNNLSWQAPEFRQYPKTLGWYIVCIACTIAVMAFFIIVESDIFAAVTMGIIAFLVIAVFAGQKPLEVGIELSTKGVHFGKLFYPYKQIRYFWVVHNENHSTVNFQTLALLNNMVILELDGQDPDKVRDFLLQFLPEHSEIAETMAQKIMHKLKF